MITREQICGTISEMSAPQAKNSEWALYATAIEMAKGEIIYRLTDRPFEDPEDILFEFCVDMELGAKIPCCISQKINPYLVAKNFAETVLVMLDCPVDE